MDKTTKIIIITIIIIILGAIIFGIVYMNFNKLDNELEQEYKPEIVTVKLENISYDILEDGRYRIYDKTGSYKTTVDSVDELNFYIDEPDFTPSYTGYEIEEDIENIEYIEE